MGMTGRVRILATRYQLLIFIIIALALSTFRVQAEPMTVKVLRVLAGDNLLVDYQGKQEIVRLLGIDAPESRISKESCPVRPIPAYKAGLYGLTETRQLSKANGFKTAIHPRSQNKVF